MLFCCIVSDAIKLYLIKPLLLTKELNCFRFTTAHIHSYKTLPNYRGLENYITGHRTTSVNFVLSIPQNSLSRDLEIVRLFEEKNNNKQSVIYITVRCKK